jgi:hypothetical protein
MPVHLAYKPIRAPREHGQALVEPAWELAAGLIEQNRHLATQAAYDVQGVPLQRLRTEARRHLLQEAQRHTRAYRDADSAAGDDGPFILAGHQPQLFHPGVWFKNFALSALARKWGGQAINLLIDNDILRNPSIRVPAGSAAKPHVISVPMDRVVATIPFEQREVADEALFGSFADRVRAAGSEVLGQPLIEDYWKLVLEARRRSPNLGRCLAEARHRLEGGWGQDTWEVPLSTICAAPAFARFACHLLAHLPQLQQIYNSSLHEYRRVNHVRSRSHPVPDLELDGPWCEAPFWLWSETSPARKRAFVRTCRDGLELTDRAGVQLQLPLTADGDAGRAVEALLAFDRQGMKLRPRALVTTMYARLVLSDLFLHGIGGAKYDHLTDLIIERFFGLQPPGFVTLSATVLLFEDATAELTERIRNARQRLREFRFQPERHVVTNDEVQGWIAEKRSWISRELPRGQRRVRHQEIERLNAQLGAALEPERERIAVQAAAWSADLRRQTSLASREFSFCLFAEDKLRPLLLDLSSGRI